jgi:cell division protein FtsQ
MKRILNIILWAIIIAGVIFVVGFINKKHDNQSLKKIIVNIQPDENDNFITHDDIYSILGEIHDSIAGCSFADIDIEAIERSISDNQYIKKSNVHVTIDGTMEIDVILRKPIVRVINTENRECYIDIDGHIMGLHKSKVSHVLIASGIIQDPLSGESVWDSYDSRNSLEDNDLAPVYKLAKFITNHEFYDAMIEQIYFNRNGDIELIPKLGNHTIILGDTNDLDKRMNKLMVFYQKGLRNMDWYKYKTINLKYNNQVVCSK